MAETNWTDEQLSAIDTRDKTLLVSAAAGSGKTATLTERIICSLLAEKSPMNIDSLLVDRNFATLILKYKKNLTHDKT